MVRVQLIGLKTLRYNGESGEVMACNKPERLGVRLDGGKMICVPTECVAEAQSQEECAICQLPMFRVQRQDMGCGHGMHWWCVTKWRQTAGRNCEAAGARCPVCRNYFGLGLASKSLLEKSAMEIVMQALGYIVQRVHRIKNLPEPSMEEELRLILELTANCEANQQSIEACAILQDAMDKYRVDEGSETKYDTLRDALVSALVVHCIPPEPQADNDAYTKAIIDWLTTLRRF